jgi:hypothetical protein
MNSRILYLTLAGIFWVFSSCVFAQVSWDVVKNKEGKKFLEVDLNTSPTHTTPVNGKLTFQISTLNDRNYCTFIYTPNNDFTGSDTLTVQYQRDNKSLSIRYAILVRNARVIAVPDLYAYDIEKKGEQALPVTENDIDEENGLKPTIVKITSKNNGLFNISDDGKNILFSPITGFSGVANITYLVCNAANEACAQTTASILIPNLKDTFEVFTPKFTPVNLPIPKDFVLLGSSTNGSLKLAGHFQEFSPNPGFEGREVLLFQNAFTKQQISVYVTVLSKKNNIYAHDDFVSSLPGGINTISLQENDKIVGNASFKILTPPKFGKILSETNGIVSYEAPKSTTFSGVDQFTYELSQDGLDKETATAYIKVSRFEPGTSVFNYYALKGMPLKVRHNFPILPATFKFEISKRGNGELRINNDNTLTFNPSNQDGLDVWGVDYLVAEGVNTWKKVSTLTLNFNVLNETSVTDPCFGDDCVWSGDTDNDGVVSLSDLLPVGQYLGKVNSSEGPSVTTSWYGKKSADWSDVGTLKYVNTDGDKYISDADTIAIRKFLGNTHGIIAKQIPVQVYTVKLKGNATVKPGEAINLDVFIGDKSKPVIDLYGFTLSLPFNKTIFDLSKSSLSFDSRSWMAYNSPVIIMTSNNKDRGVLEAAYTRTSGKAADGFGKVGTARIIVTDIAGIKPSDGSNKIQVNLGGGQASAIDANGNSFGLYVEPFMLTIDFSGMEEKKNTDSPVIPILSPAYNNGASLDVFPNPAMDFVKIRSGQNDAIKSVQIVNMSGQIIYQANNLDAFETEISTSNIQTGVYYIRIISEKVNLTRKLQILHR